MTTLRSSFPIDFDLYDENEEPVLFITDDVAGQELTLEIVNTSDRPVSPEPLSGRASAEIHHFELRFRPGTLYNSPAAVELQSRDFEMFADRDDYGIIRPNTDGTLSLYFKAQTVWTLQRNDKVLIKLGRIRAAARGGTRGTRVMLKYQNLLHAGNTESFSGFRELHLNIVNHRGRKNIPLHAGFVGSNTVLNDGDHKNTLRLRVTNISRKAIALEADANPLLLEAHEYSVFTLAFSADSRYLASGGYDNTVRLWDLADLSARPVVLRHEDLVNTLSFSADSRYLATVSNDNAARLWDLADLNAGPAVLEGHKNFVFSLAFSPDHRYLATGSADSTARVWNLTDPNAEPLVLAAHADVINTLSFSADNRYLATGSSDNSARLWDLADLMAEPLLLSHPATINTLAFSPDNRYLATAGNDNITRLWDLTGLSAGPVLLEGHASATSINTLAFSPDNRYLVTGDNASARLWNLADLNIEPVTLEGSVRALAFSPDGRYLATCNEDTGDSSRSIRLWWDLEGLVAGQGAGSKLVLTADGGPPHDEWTLATDDQLQDIDVWVTYPSESRREVTKTPGFNVWQMPFKKLGQGEYIDIDIEDLVTDHSSGPASLYLHYEDIPGYWNGQFVAVVEKTPLVSRNKKIGIGTSDPQTALDVDGEIRSKKYQFSADSKWSGQNIDKPGEHIIRFTKRNDPFRVYDESDNRFKTPTSGYYFFTTTLTFGTGNNVGDGVIVGIFRNGDVNDVNSTIIVVTPGLFKNLTAQSVTAIMNLHKGDFVDVRLQGVDDSRFNVSYCSFIGMMINK